MVLGIPVCPNGIVQQLGVINSSLDREGKEKLSIISTKHFSIIVSIYSLYAMERII